MREYTICRYHWFIPVLIHEDANCPGFVLRLRNLRPRNGLLCTLRGRLASMN